ncbi:MAG: FAD-binding oxidoreductase, partial [candidate division NC10 bacterium]|nr:FAD-binding oxidoreductase [candidate division NC10 bacterium]
MIDGRRPEGIVSVRSLEEAAKFLKAAGKSKISVIPRGSGTKMGWGNPPRSADLVLDLSGLRGILEYNPENLTVTAECGLPLSGLQEALATKGQFLPLDPPHFLSASLGGIVACNAYGPRRLIYGTARDMVLGMRVALADGSLVNLGGRCVKNVSGYDLCKLFIGSLGTLGIIGEMTFKVYPLPEQEVIQVGAFGEAAQALGLAESLLHSALFPSALEVLDPPLASVWAEQMGISHRQQDWLLLIGWAGFSEDIARLLGEGRSAFLRHQGRDGEVCESARAKRGWEVLGHLTRYLKIWPEGFVLCRICLPLAQVGEGVARWQSEVATQGLQSALLIRAG